MAAAGLCHAGDDCINLAEFEKLMVSTGLFVPEGPAAAPIGAAAPPPTADALSQCVLVMVMLMLMLRVRVRVSVCVLWHLRVRVQTTEMRALITYVKLSRAWFKRSDELYRHNKFGL